MSDFSPAEFRRFCNTLRVDTKELGTVTLGRQLMGSQKWVLREITRGLEDGVHDFVTLKARQLGISTVSLAIDLYWLGKYPSMTGALVMHDDPARDQFRETLSLYYDGLPAKYKQPEKLHNRNQWVFANNSRLNYRVAGTKKKGGTLGRSAALTFLHATEVAFWGDPAGFAALRASLAQQHPNRLYHWETTANGFNYFHDMWQEAKKAHAQRAIFVSWWANEFYSIPREDHRFKIYYGANGMPTSEERRWIHDVRMAYGVEITREQIAWYRWMSAELQVDDQIRAQEYPHTEEDAFIATGAAFFSALDISEGIKRLAKRETPKSYRVLLRDKFQDTELVTCPDKVANLWVWEEPVAGAYYTLGADPAYGGGGTSNANAIVVRRVFGDTTRQVAVFRDTTCNTFQFAWVIVYLAGCYEECAVNVEANGPGQAVINEMQNLKKERYFGDVSQQRTMFNVMRGMREYLYRKFDSIRGDPTAVHTNTNLQTKERMMNMFRDYFARGMAPIEIRRELDEMKSVVREEGKAPGAPSRGQDDIVMADALCVMIYNDQVRSKLLLAGITMAAEQVKLAAASRSLSPATTVAQRLTMDYLKKIRIVEEARERPASVRAHLNPRAVRTRTGGPPKRMV